MVAVVRELRTTATQVIQLLDADDPQVRVLVEVHPKVDELVGVREAVLGAVPQRDQRQVVTDRDLLGLLVVVDALGIVLLLLGLLEQVVELLVAVTTLVVTGGRLVGGLGADR